MRLFVAINLPEDLRSAVWEACHALRARSYPVRWVDAGAIHLTLKFLGDVEETREPVIVDAVRSAVQGTRPFPLSLDGFGAFPTPRRPRVVWVGCEAAPPLELLQDRVERNFAAVGFPVEGRAFHPHLTLGRARRDARPRDFTGIERELADLDFHGELVVSSVDLMQSVLAPQGARYTRRHAAALAG
jgi:2'-5' RNA ligase